MQKQNDKLIRITMLGNFQISVGNCVISVSSKRTNQLWNLLEYLITFRNKSISQEKLIEVLWPEDNCDNPNNALKNLIYRVRMLFLEKDIPFAKDIILFHRGLYHWNNELNCIIDVEEFEKFYRMSVQAIEPLEKIELYQRAITLYNGNFLPNSSHESWVIPLASYYRSIYFKCVSQLVKLLLEKKHYEEVINVCENAIIIDSYEENPHKYLILAFIKRNKYAAALEHYNYVTNLFYRELGIQLSEDMRSLYYEITKSINSIETNLDSIKDELTEHCKIEGSYFCDYAVFKSLYRIEARMALRTGQSILLGLITVTDKMDEMPDISQINNVMDKLLIIIKKNLRKGDIVSRFSVTQYIFMFPSLNVEKGHKALSRVLDNFYKEYNIDSIKLHLAVKSFYSAL